MGKKRSGHHIRIEAPLYAPLKKEADELGATVSKRVNRIVWDYLLAKKDKR